MEAHFLNKHAMLRLESSTTNGCRAFQSQHGMFILFLFDAFDVLAGAGIDANFVAGVDEERDVENSPGL